jgi:hypothetical protein
MKHFNKIKVLFALCLFALFSGNAFSQGVVTTLGKEFWVAFGANYAYSSSEVTLQVRIVAEKATTGRIVFTTDNTFVNFSVAAGGVYTYSLTLTEKNKVYTSRNRGSAGTVTDNKSLYITADNLVSVYALNLGSASTDATHILPVEALGTAYYALSYPSPYDSDGYAIVATENNTVIRENGSQVATLSRGQIWRRYGATGSDLTGRNITSNAPVAFFTTNQGTQVPNGTSAVDCIYGQLSPVHSWGSTFLVPVTHRGVERVRIVASQANTTITQTGGTVISGSLNRNAGQFVELEVRLSNNGCYISADKPVAVSSYLMGTGYSGLSYANGDPAIGWIPPLEQTVQKTTFAPFFPTGGSNLSTHYVLISTPTASRNSTTIAMGGNSPQALSGGTWRENSNSGYSFYSLQLTQNSAYTIENKAGVTVLGYGLGSAESYYYLAGAAARRLDAVFYINDILYDEAAEQSFSPGLFTIKAETDFTMSSATGHLRWYIDDEEEISARDMVQWTKDFLTPGTYNIKMVVISESNEEITIESKIMIPDFRWFYISSPYSNATSNNFDKPSGTIGTASTSGGSLLGYYNESDKEYSNPLGLGVTFAPGRGIVAQLDINIPEFNSPTIATFANGSTPNPSSFTVAVTNTDGDKAGKNLLGNPYLTAIDYDALVSLGSNSDVIDPSYWIRYWDGSTMAFESYNTTVGGGTGALTSIIPTVQAFWVHSKVASGDVLFSNTIAVSPSPAPSRSPESKVSRIARLKIGSTDRDRLDEMLLALHPGASNIYDVYKTEKMSNNDRKIPELYTKIGNRELSINGIPPVNNEVTVPLGFRTGESGNFTISSTFENWDNTRIFLRDNNKGIETELTADESYSFSSDVYDNTSRFSIIIKGAPLGVNTVEHNTKIFVNEKNRIVVETDIPNAECVVYNTLGQQLSSETVTLCPRTLDCVLESGVYLVKLGNKTERVVIK